MINKQPDRLTPQPVPSSTSERLSAFTPTDLELLRASTKFFRSTPIVEDLIAFAAQGNGSGAIGLGDYRQLNIYADGGLAFTTYFPDSQNDSIRLRIGSHDESLGVGTLIFPPDRYQPGTIEQHFEGVNLPETISLDKLVELQLNFSNQSLYHRVINEKPIVSEQIWSQIAEQFGKNDAFTLNLRQGKTVDGRIYSLVELHFNPTESDGSPTTIDNEPSGPRAIQGVTMLFQGDNLLVKHTPPAVPSGFFYNGEFDLGTPPDRDTPFVVQSSKAVHL